MAKRTLEGDALQDMTSILNHGISDQVQPIPFGEVMSSANFVSDQTVKNVTSRGGSNYTEVSAIMVAVRSHICTQRKQEMVTQKFNEFVLILHNELRLDALAQQLVDKLIEKTREKRPSYKSPLDKDGSSGPNPPSGAAGGTAGTTVGTTQQFSISMSVDDLYSWLLLNNMPSEDCELIKDKKINGRAFKRITEAQWEKLGVSFGGKIIVDEIMEQIHSSSPGPANSSTSNDALRNVSSNGAQNGQSNGVHLSSGETGPTLGEFISFPLANGGKANLAQEIGTNYTNFGILLLKDANGDRTETIVRECHERGEEINTRIFRLWLKGGGLQPLSWATLAGVLKDMELRVLASKVEHAKGAKRY